MAKEGRNYKHSLQGVQVSNVLSCRSAITHHNTLYACWGKTKWVQTRCKPRYGCVDRRTCQTGLGIPGVNGTSPSIFRAGHFTAGTAPSFTLQKMSEKNLHVRFILISRPWMWGSEESTRTEKPLNMLFVAHGRQSPPLAGAYSAMGFLKTTHICFHYKPGEVYESEKKKIS